MEEVSVKAHNVCKNSIIIHSIFSSFLIGSNLLVILPKQLQPVPKVLETLYRTYFGINGYDHVLVIPPPPITKVASYTRPSPCSKREGTTLNGREDSISHRPMTSSDLKYEKSFFHGRVSTFLQLVAALTNLISKTFAISIEMMSIHMVQDFDRKRQGCSRWKAGFFVGQTGFFYSTATSILPYSFVFQCN